MGYLRTTSVSDWLRAAAAAGLAVAIGIGCFVDRSGLAPVRKVYQCRADLQSSSGDAELGVQNTDTGPLMVSIVGSPGCPGLANDAEVEEWWERWLGQQVTAAPEFASRGTWCVAPDEDRCQEMGDADPSLSCSSALTALPITDCPPPAGACLDVSPVLDFGAWDVGSTSTSLSVTVRNSCSDAVRLHADGTLVMDRSDFRLSANSCEPTTPEEILRGRELTPLGTAGDSCALAFEFTPTRHGSRQARTSVVQDFSMRSDVTLQGTGNGGVVNVPGALCLGPITGPQPECSGPGLTGRGTAVDLPLTHVSGPAVEVEGLAPAGGVLFRVSPTLPPGSLTVPAGGDARARVVWCEAVGSGDVSGMGFLNIATNGLVTKDGRPPRDDGMAQLGIRKVVPPETCP